MIKNLRASVRNVNCSADIEDGRLYMIYFVRYKTKDIFSRGNVIF